MNFRKIYIDTTVNLLSNLLSFANNFEEPESRNLLLLTFKTAVTSDNKEGCGDNLVRHFWLLDRKQGDYFF